MRTAISSRWFFLVGIAVLALLFVAFSKIVYVNYGTHQNIANLEEEIRSLETNQQKLKELSQFLETDYFAEREARIKLGMQKKGEQAVIIEGAPPESAEKPVAKNATPQKAISAAVSEGASNTQQWWDYFFAHRKF